MKAVALILLFLALVAGGLAFGAWIIMLIWGALANFFGFRTIPFGVAFLIALLLWFVGKLFGGSK